MSFKINFAGKLTNGTFSINPDCKLYVIHVKIWDSEQRIRDIISTITDTSWLTSVNDAITREAYEAAANRTIQTLMNSIFNICPKNLIPISKNTGEYVISITAQDVLGTRLTHKKIPLAELWKDRAKGNSGFDFHTVTPSNLILFGEAKFNKTTNAHMEALTQISQFISEKKDKHDKKLLESFINIPQPFTYLENGERAFCAAFSLKGKKYKDVFKNAVHCAIEQKLDQYPELFIMGIEICQ